MIIELKKLSIYLYFFTFCSVFFNQFTLYISTRISLPFRYLEVLVFILLVFFYFLSFLKKENIETSISRFSIFFWFILVFFGNLLVNLNTAIEGNSYIFISSFIFIHSLVIIYFFTNLTDFDELKKLSIFLIKFHIILSLIFYLFYIIGINQISLGVHDPQDNWPRARGFFAEPSHYSIFAWISFMYFFFIERENKVFLFLSFIAFVLSIASTGYIFAFLNILLIVFFRNLKYLFYFIPFGVFIILLIPENYLIRDVLRVYEEILFLAEFASNQNWQNFDYTNGSRVILFIRQFSYLDLNIMSILFGLGPGGQAIVLNSLQDIFNGPIYLIAEFGLISFIFFLYFFSIIFKRTNNDFKPLLLAYLFISFFNPPGGNFGIDFIFIYYLIFIISETKIQSHEEHKI